MIMCAICEHTLPTPQLRRKPLTAAEFVGPLSKIDPIYKEEEEAFKVRDRIGLVKALGY